jgi:hypothetical protein
MLRVAFVFFLVRRRVRQPFSDAVKRSLRVSNAKSVMSRQGSHAHRLRWPDSVGIRTPGLTKSLGLFHLRAEPFFDRAPSDLSFQSHPCRHKIVVQEKQSLASLGQSRPLVGLRVNRRKDSSISASVEFGFLGSEANFTQAQIKFGGHWEKSVSTYGSTLSLLVTSVWGHPRGVSF